MFDHLEFSVGSINDARRFYVPICEAIGAHEVFLTQILGNSELAQTTMQISTYRRENDDAQTSYLFQGTEQGKR